MHCDDSPAPAPEWSLNSALISRPLIDLNRAFIESSLFSTPFSTAHFPAHLKALHTWYAIDDCTRGMQFRVALHHAFDVTNQSLQTEYPVLYFICCFSNIIFALKSARFKCQPFPSTLDLLLPSLDSAHLLKPLKACSKAPSST